MHYNRFVLTIIIFSGLLIMINQGINFQNNSLNCDMSFIF